MTLHGVQPKRDLWYNLLLLLQPVSTSQSQPSPSCWLAHHPYLLIKRMEERGGNFRSLQLHTCQQIRLLQGTRTQSWQDCPSFCLLQPCSISQRSSHTADSILKIPSIPPPTRPSYHMSVIQVLSHSRLDRCHHRKCPAPGLSLWDTNCLSATRLWFHHFPAYTPRSSLMPNFKPFSCDSSGFQDPAAVPSPSFPLQPRGEGRVRAVAASSFTLCSPLLSYPVLLCLLFAEFWPLPRDPVYTGFTRRR